MSNSQVRSSASLTPDEARDLVIDLERSGLDTARIHVEAAPPMTVAAVGRTDRRAFARPGIRVFGGVVAGAVLGLGLGFIVRSVSGTSTGAIMLALTIGGAIIGGLVGLYSRLAMSTELTDVDSGVASTVQVDVSGLSQDDLNTVDRVLASSL